MAHHTENSIKVNVPAEKIWQVLADYSGIENFAATIKSSPIVGGGARGQVLPFAPTLWREGQVLRFAFTQNKRLEAAGSCLFPKRTAHDLALYFGTLF